MPALHQRKTRFLVLFLLVFLASLLLFSSSASAADYSDTKGHWAEKTIARWSDSGILKGYSDGRFGPNDPVTRAQLAEVLYRIWGCKPKQGHTYPDLSSTAWYYEGLSTMNAYGVALDRDGRINPDEPLTREEAFYMVAKAFQVGSHGLDNTTVTEIKGVADAAELTPIYSQKISSMFYAKYLKGTPDGKFHPKAEVTRAEVMTSIDNIVDVYISKPGTYSVSSDQVALVTSPGVTIQYVPKWENRSHYLTLYLMGGASESGISLNGTTFMLLYVRGVSEEKPVWTNNGLNSITDKTLHLNDPNYVPDLRFAGGLGSVHAPYLIKTPDQFAAIADVNASIDGFSSELYLKLESDITLPGNQPMIDPKAFRLHLDGGGHTLTYHRKDDAATDRQLPFFFDTNLNIGLFNVWMGSLSNLTLAGTLDLTIDPETPFDSIYVGGFSGEINGPVTNCATKQDLTVRYTGTKKKPLYVGGLAGKAGRTRYEGCTASGSITVLASTGSDVGVGGLAGISSPNAWGGALSTGGPPAASVRVVPFIRCGSTTVISVTGGNHSMVGGLIGTQTYPINDTTLTSESYGLVENSWSTAKITASEAKFQSDCGGLVGALVAGTIRNSWAKPTISISDASFKNIGGITGKCAERGKISDCWVNASGLTVPDKSGHYGGISGGVLGSVSNCYVLGTEKFAPENAISYVTWTDTPPTSCIDMATATAAQRETFYQACGWDFTNIWDKSGSYPVIRTMGKAVQQAAQG